MSELNVDTINEQTSANGVTIDGVLIKDGQVDGVDVSTLSVDTDTNGLVLISSTNASTATDITFDNVFTSTYQNYKMILNNFKCDSGGDMRLTFRNGGSSGADITSKHDSRYWYISSSSGWLQGTASANANYVMLSNGTGTSSSYSFNIELWNPQVSTVATTGFMTGSWKDGGHLQTGMSLDSLEEVTGVKLFASSGTVSGDIYLYGYSKT
jgi:hypothetical protein